MKKMILMAVAAMMAMSVNAQVTVDMSQCFEVPEKATDLNDAATVKDGVVFVGDTRPAEKIQDGKYKGMRIQKQGRYYSDGGISLHTFTFSGQTDKAFTGTDPVAAAKKISKANKK